MANNKEKNERQKNWIAIITTLVLVLVGVAIFAYYFFFRQVNARLIETVPVDAAFVYQVNDNEVFKKNLQTTLPFFREVLAFDAVSGCEFFFEQLANKEDKAIFSGHITAGELGLLFSCRTEDKNFENLLKSLNIDKRNHIVFNDCEIFNHGTHLKKFYFTFYNGFFTVSENIEVLKKSIAQLRTFKNLIQKQNFKSLLEVIEKNKKQNWLILQNEIYFPYFENILQPQSYAMLQGSLTGVEWIALQLRCEEEQILMSGYAVGEGLALEKFMEQTPKTDKREMYMPAATTFYMTSETDKPQLYAAALKEENLLTNSVSLFSKLQPSAHSYFRIKSENVTYDYIAFETPAHFSDTLLNGNNYLKNADVVAKSNYSYVTFDSLPYQPVLLDYLPTVHLQAMLIQDSVTIFSTSREALDVYSKMVAKDKITENNYYKMAVPHLPSNVHASLFFSAVNSSDWNRHIASKTAFRPLKEIKIFALNRTVVAPGMMTINLYIK